MMTHDNNKGTNQKSNAPPRFYKVGGFCFFFLLLISAGANTSLRPDNEQAGSMVRERVPAQPECEDGKSGKTVTIVFEGLFYFSFPDGRAGNYKREYCDVGILSSRQDHALYVEFEGDAEMPAMPNLMFSRDTLQSQPNRIEIYKEPQPAQADVSIYGAPGHTGWGLRSPEDRNDPEVNPKYFNWIIDFEDNTLHNRNLDEKSESARPVLRIMTGCFRTGYLSTFPYFTVKNGIVRKYGFVAATIEAVITLNSEEKVMFKWGSVDPVRVPVGVTKVKLYNVRHEHRQYILKNRAQQHVNEQVAQIHTPHADDLNIYYEDFLKGPSKKDRFHFIPDISGTAKARVMTPPFICYGTGGSRN